MKPIAIDEFCNFKFLSNIEFSPEGGSACFVVSSADKKKNDYRSYLYLRKDGKIRKLTSGGKERSFRYMDENTILFRADREEKDGAEKVPDLTSRFYQIRLDGGEAEIAYTFPIPVSRIIPLPDGNMIVTGQTLPGFEELYRGGKKELAAWQKYVKENADYEEIRQVPWWWNGATYTKGAYQSLFYYDAKKKSLRRLSSPGENAADPELSPDKKSIFYLSTPVRPYLPLSGCTSICRMDICGAVNAGGKTAEEAKTGENAFSDGAAHVKRLLECNDKFEIAGIVAAEHFLLVLASDKKYGLNTDVDFYRMDYETGELSLYAKYGEAVGTSVGTDIRYGGGHSIRADGDTVYFISTRFDGSGLYKLENGEITEVLVRPGSVDSFDVKKGKILLTGLFDMKAQELYDENGRKRSSFNDAALRGKYTAQPEMLCITRGDSSGGGSYDIHGFVLKPMDYDPEKKYPVILDIHGGPKTVYGPVFYHEMQYWAGKGYFVIFCNPTGSDGRGAFMDIRGKYGTVDYEDIMAFADAALKEYPAMDPEHLYETGGSYGGFMTNWIIGHTDRFRACASQRSISNWFSFYGVSDIGVEFAMDQCDSDPWNNPEKLWEQSPMKYADRVKTPTLFIHSFEDYRCPIDQGYQMFTSLIAHGVDSKMICFRGENHELSRSGKPLHRIRRIKEITEWFENHA